MVLCSVMGLIQYTLCTVFQDTSAGLTGRPISLPVGLCSVTDGLLSGQQIGFLKVGATSNWCFKSEADVGGDIQYRVWRKVRKWEEGKPWTSAQKPRGRVQGSQVAEPWPVDRGPSTKHKQTLSRLLCTLWHLPQGILSSWHWKDSCLERG